ncbi:type VII secretion protein EccCb [Dactylosporangium cerinum]|uniref:Type VII secretion protein EccCb n=1 Tax=Dactylosporangium cerinum TaxID=1434730 RepID=A0ABV9WGC1_9ACTN
MRAIEDRIAVARETVERQYPVEAAVRAVHELGELALLPGSDLLGIARALVDASDHGPEPLVAAARTVLQAVTSLAPAPVVADGGRDGQVRFEALLGLGDPGAFEPATAWRRLRGRLRVPLGVGTDGTPVTIDFTDATHGLIVGAPGSGKSELLRAVILALAVAHPPEDVNFVFVDHHGGSTFAPFELLPHTAAMMTGIGWSPDLIDRCFDTIAGELSRRAAPGWTGPALFVVVDEFTELLTSRPDVIDLFVQVGRVGRSLGVHQLLATQRLEEGRLRGLDNYLPSRIALRTFSTRESRAAIGVPDAYELPMTPGAGYLRTGSDAPVRFRGPTAFHRYWPQADPAWQRVLHSLAAWGSPNVAEVLVDRMRAAAPPVRPLWLPPLTSSPTLGSLPADAPGRGVPLARVDVPFERRYDVLTVPIDDGNIAIVGGPRSGKSTALQTLALGLAQTHTPAELQVYAIGQALAPLTGLPHTAGVADRRGDLVPRILGELHARLDRPLAGRAYLLVDDWGVARDDFEDLLLDLAVRGPAHGIHLAVTARRWAELRPRIRDTVTARIELRLGDPAESGIDRRAASRVPYDLPGRGLTADRLQMMVARPQLTEDGDLDAAVAAIRAAWPFEPAPAVSPVPERLSPAVLPEPRRGLLPIGVEQITLRPVAVDFAAEPHLIVLGDEGSGKTSFLRGLARSIERAYRPEDARIVVVDYRRGLLGAVGEPHLIGYCTGPQRAGDVVHQVVDAFKARVRGPELFLLVDDYDLVADATNPLADLTELLPRAGEIGLHVVIARRVRGAGRAMFEPVLRTLRDLSAPGILLSGPREEGQVFAGVTPEILPPGRGWRVSRRDGRRLIQLAWHQPPLPASAA